jgi:hypothetical protein
MKDNDLTPLDAAMIKAQKREKHDALRPKLSIENVPDYLDWLTSGLHLLAPEHVGHHLTAAELVVRLRMADVQGKATAHTDGV